MQERGLVDIGEGEATQDRGFRCVCASVKSCTLYDDCVIMRLCTA